MVVDDEPHRCYYPFSLGGWSVSHYIGCFFLLRVVSLLFVYMVAIVDVYLEV